MYKNYQKLSEKCAKFFLPTVITLEDLNQAFAESKANVTSILDNFTPEEAFPRLKEVAEKHMFDNFKSENYDSNAKVITKKGTSKENQDSEQARDMLLRTIEYHLGLTYVANQIENPTEEVLDYAKNDVHSDLAEALKGFGATKDCGEGLVWEYQTALNRITGKSAPLRSFLMPWDRRIH